MKKVIKIIAILVILVVAMCLPYWVNDVACCRYKKDVEKRIAQVPDIRPIEIIHGCGNTTGTGDNTRLWVGVLVKSNSAELVLNGDFDDVQNVQEYNDNNTILMINKNLKFTCSIDNNEKNYFIVEFVKEAPFSWLDLRGS